MPYRLLYDPLERGYYVETKKTGRLHSRHALDHDTAVRQMRALYRSVGREPKAGDFIPFIKSIPSRITGFFQGKRLNYRPQDREFLGKYGNETIKEVYVLRTPLDGILDKVMSLISLGKFDKMKAEYNYTDYYHLFVVVRLSDGVFVRIEKNQTIELKVLGAKPKVEESMDVFPRQEITLNELLNNAEKLMGKEAYFVYDPKHNNCQVFVKSLLEANGMLTSDLEDFVMQDVSSLPSFTHSIARAVTDLGHKVDILASGKGFDY